MCCYYLDLSITEDQMTGRYVVCICLGQFRVVYSSELYFRINLMMSFAIMHSYIV